MGVPPMSEFRFPDTGGTPVPRQVIRRLNGRVFLLATHSSLPATLPAMKILITGVTRGLGRALTEKFIALGHTVIGCGRSGTEIFDLRMNHGAPHDFMVCDVALDNKVALW